MQGTDSKAAVRGGFRLPRLPPPPAALRRLIGILPTEPPSFALAALLNRLLLPRLDASARAALSSQKVEIFVSDFGVRVRLVLQDDGFSVAERGGPARLRIAAPVQTYWRLVAGEEDADTLFFERALVMEGDTEYGLLLKNTLDAIGPLVPALLRR